MVLGCLAFQVDPPDLLGFEGRIEGDLRCHVGSGALGPNVKEFKRY